MRKNLFFVFFLTICLLILGTGWSLAEEDVQGVIENTPGYWTQEKIDEALRNPADIKREGEPELKINTEPSGPPIMVPPNIKGRNSLNELDLTAPFAPSLSCPASAYSWAFDTNNTNYPECAIGKLFFVASDGKRMVCSASLVAADIILTAGHCVSSNQKWHTQIQFIPGYLYGEAPFGVFSVKSARVKLSWFNSGNFGRDVAFAKLWTPAGNATGWLGQLYDVNPASLQWYQSGYPAETPFDGELLAINLAGYGGTHPTLPPATAVGSALTKGSSGGPWIVIRNNGPYANSVNSFELISCPLTKGGPLFDTDIHDMFINVRDN